MIFSPLHQKIGRIDGTRSAMLGQVRSRIMTLCVIFIVAYALIAIRTVDLMLVQGHTYRLAKSDPASTYVARAEKKLRGNIYDRNGHILATSIETSSLYADPSLVMAGDVEALSAQLIKIFPELDYPQLVDRLSKPKRFVWIKRHLNPREQADVLNIGHPALAFRREEKRLFPQGELSAHLVGYNSTDGNGLAGVEGYFDASLKEKDLNLSMDIRLQHILRRDMLRAVEAFEADGAMGLIMDVHSGEVLASVSLPDFDPNNVSDSEVRARFNKVSHGVYEMGSTFKIFSTAALIENENGAMTKSFDARQPIKVGRFKINDYHAEDRILTLPEVFIYSSNIGAAKMGEMLGDEKMQQFYRDLGLMNPANIELNEVGNPIIPDPWRPVHTLTSAYGHGMAVSPLQLVSAAASVVNGGYKVQPTLLRQDIKPHVKDHIRVVSPQTAHRMRQLMRLTVTHGTGGHAEVEGYIVGGKTGTAEKTSAKGGYSAKRLRSSFMGFFPMNDPRYAVFVMVDEPKGNAASYGYATGGWVAAPVVGSVIANMVSVLGIAPYQQKQNPQDDLAASLVSYIRVEDDK